MQNRSSTFWNKGLVKKKPTFYISPHPFYWYTLIRTGKIFFPCKLGKISLQQGRFPSSLGWFPLHISLFFPSKSQNFLARSFPFYLFFSRSALILRIFWTQLYDSDFSRPTLSKECWAYSEKSNCQNQIPLEKWKELNSHFLNFIHLDPGGGGGTRLWLGRGCAARTLGP